MNFFPRGASRSGLGLALCAALALLAGCGDAPPPETAQTTTETSTRPYAGRTIMVIAPKLSGGLISGPVVQEAQTFGERTGATVRVVRPGWNETIEKIRASLDGPEEHYDVFMITTSWSGPLFAKARVAEVPEAIKRQVEWEDILPIYRDNILSWNGRAYALPYDGDTVTLYYRKDLFENEDYRQKFLETHGYPLAPPKTWKQYNDVAKFFYNWDWNQDGKVEYGTAGSRLVNTSAMLIFLSRAAAYAKHPDDPAYYFDPDDMRPRINHPGFVRALEDYIEEVNYAPPGMINFAASDVRRLFITGQVALAIDWANIGIDSENSPLSVVKGKVGYALLPGSEEVYNARNASWERRYNSAAAMVGNYLFLVNKDSKNQDLAFAFAAHMTSREMTGRLTVTADTGVNPSRRSHLDDAASWTAHGFTPEDAARYLDTLAQAIAEPNYVFDIRIPGSERYYQSLDEGLYQALKGELSPQAALDQVAARWDAITESLGRDSQRELYRQSLNLPISPQ